MISSALLSCGFDDLDEQSVAREPRPSRRPDTRNGTAPAAGACRYVLSRSFAPSK